MSTESLETSAPSTARTLRRLFLTLFLRGRAARGLRRKTAPRSVASRLWLILTLYAALGCLAFAVRHAPVFELSLYLHAITFTLLGLTVSGSAGEVLFNREEADILMHRPVTPRALLWAKVAVLVQVSLWLACALNLAGFFIGAGASDGSFLFPVVHLISTALEALFCTGSIVLAYQLCLRWFGRERLDGIMTTSQVIISVIAFIGGQVVPHLMVRPGGVSIPLGAWWLLLLPPAWFAGLDDVVAGSHAQAAWPLAVLGLTATAAVLWLAFARLAEAFGSGLQALAETAPSSGSRRGLHRLDKLARLPPLRWALPDSASRASFLLVATYLLRDRDVKLRVYPGIAPLLAMPLGPLLAGGRGVTEVGLPFTTCFLGTVPLFALFLLQQSQNWQAADVFRAAPLHGPGPLGRGARVAVTLFLTLPLLTVAVTLALFLGGPHAQLLLLLPGAIALPLYTLLSSLGSKSVPFSMPPEQASGASRMLYLMGGMIPAGVLATATHFAWSGGWFTWLLLGETILVAGGYLALRGMVANVPWERVAD